MSLLAYIPGAKLFSKLAKKDLDKISQASEALHNALGPVNVRDQDVDYDEPQAHGSKIIQRFRTQVRKGLPLSLDIHGLSGVVDALKHSKALDDRKMLLEHALIFLSRLPSSTLSSKLQDEVVQFLFFDLAHPPATYLGTKYTWRSADGSGNNIHLPDLGKAGMPYSRSVQATHALIPSELPDAELIYQSLLKRDKFVEHPSGLSSLMFGFAALVIHSIFRTSFTDWSINETSSYIDLAPLYGNNQKEQDHVRIKDGYGRLHPDVIAEDRLLLLPPASASLIVLFNRNHNYIAKKLFEINERGTYVDPATFSGEDSEANRLAQDNEIFNTTRLINCTWFANVVFSDYFSAILGLVRDGSSWSLNPFGPMRRSDHTLVERGLGNSVSIEFNLLYRWHPTMSQADEKWTEAVFKKIFDKPLDQLTVRDFGTKMREIQKNENPDPSTWTFGGLTRDGEKFKDADLARILQDATSHPACAFKARGTPEVMRVIEIMGIEQARKWGTCSLNDFRRFLQLKPYADFNDWNTDPKIAETARKLYGDIENLELYPGLQAEEPKPVVPGAGLCPPYTISRAILADAMALTRGDRFFTTDFTPWNMTAWGFHDCQRDDSNGGFGSMLGRLLLRTLPEHYTYDSVYTWFPLMTPESMKKYLTKLELVQKYSFSRPEVSPQPQVIDSFQNVWGILRDHESFRTPYSENAKDLMKGSGYLLSLDNFPVHQKDAELIHNMLVNDVEALDRAAQLYYAKTRDLIQERSFLLSGDKSRSIDIVSNVLNLVPMHFVATLIAGLPIKSEEQPHGTYRERELLQMLRDIFSYIFLQVEPAKRLAAKDLAKVHTEELLDNIKKNLRQAKIAKGLPGGSGKGPKFLQDLVATGKDIDELANHALSVAIISSVEFAQALIHVVNFYMEDTYAEHRQKIIELVGMSGGGSDAQLQGYVREALRLDPSLRGAYRYANVDVDVNGLKIAKDQLLYLNFSKANIDSETFPDATKVDQTRPAEGYLSLNDAVYGALGDHFVEKTIAQVLRAVFSLKNLRRGPGQSGKLRRILDFHHCGPNYVYIDSKRELSPWARSMVLQYDD